MKTKTKNARLLEKPDFFHNNLNQRAKIFKTYRLFYDGSLHELAKMKT